MPLPLMIPYRFLSLLVPLLLLLVPLKAAEEIVNGIAAIVNGEVVTFTQVRELAAAQEKSAAEVYHGDELQKKLKDVRQQAIKDLIDRALILQEFKKKEFNIPGYVVDDSVQRIIRQEFGGDRMAFVKTLQAQGFSMARFHNIEKDKITVQAMRQSRVSDNIIVSPVKIRDFYSKNSSAYTTAEQVKLRMIVLREGGAAGGDASNDPGVGKKQMASEIHDKLVGGAEFARLAQMYSEDSTNEAGGDWGWIERKTLNEELAKVAFSLKQGEISPVIKVDNAYYILMVESKKLAITKPLGEVQQEIVQNLIQHEKLKTQDQWLESLRKKAYIKIL